jgi:hypothetical protein
MALGPTPPPPREFWVAPFGNINQTWPFCSPTQPFLTLDQARLQIRAYRAAGYNAAHDITVHVAGGEYVLEDTVVFTSQDSGWPGKPIKYVAWDPDGAGTMHDDDPMFSGGYRLTGCTIETSGLTFCNTTLNIWKCDVPNFVPDVRDVWLNRRRMLRARYPNVPDICPYNYFEFPDKPPAACKLKGFLAVNNVQAIGTLPGSSAVQEVTLRRESSAPAWPLDIDQIDFEIVGHPQYLSPRQKVASGNVTMLDATRLIVEFPVHRHSIPGGHLDLGGFGVYNHDNPASQAQHIRGELNLGPNHQHLATVVVLEGAREFLDAHEEWHFTPPTGPQAPGTLRIALCASHTDLNQEDLVVPVLEELLRFDEAAWIEFHGLDFAYSHFPFPTQYDGTPGYSSFHSGMQWTGQVEPPDILGGAIFMQGAQGIRFLECRIAHTGATAVKITTKVLANPTVYRPSHMNSLQRCEIFDVGGKAVHIGDPFTRSNEWTDPPDPSKPHALRFNELVESKIYQYGLIYKDAPAITLCNVSDTFVAYNEVSFGNWAAMEVGTHGRSASHAPQWSTLWACSGPDSTQGTRIEYNHVHRACLGLVDCGGVYMAGTHYYSTATPISSLVGNYIVSMQPSPYLNHAGGVNGLYFDRGADQWYFARNLIRNVQRLMHFNNQQSGEDNEQVPPPYNAVLFGLPTWPVPWTQFCPLGRNDHLWPGQCYHVDAYSDEMANRWFFPGPSHNNQANYYKRFSRAEKCFGSSALPTSLNENVFLDVGLDATADAIRNAAGPADGAAWFPGTGARIYPLPRLCNRRCGTITQPNPQDDSDFDLWNWEWDW